MPDSTTKDFPDWENLYKNQNVETMPWYNENFDSDLERELDERKIVANGKKFLDIGTGPATQAIWLANRGFNVVGSDLAQAAINRARKIYGNEKNVNFIVDDILNTKLKSNEFDYIFDRGCFHVLLPRDRKEYINKIKKILKDNGILFLKCFSDKEPVTKSPWRKVHTNSRDEIRDLFSESFKIDSIRTRILSHIKRLLVCKRSRINKCPS
jgi:SAM-dependent methyltransferase